MDDKNKRQQLREMMLSRAGSTVVVVGNDKTVDLWMERGQFMSGKDSIIEDGTPMMCHYNSLDFYLNNPGIRICTGFAINFDGLSEVWVRHSWCIDQEGRIHECTPIKRDIYFGVILETEEEVEDFRIDWDYAYAAKVADRKRITPIKALENALNGTTPSKVDAAGYLESTIPVEEIEEYE